MTKLTARLDITADPPVLVNQNCCDLCGACVGVCPSDCIVMNEHTLRIIGMDCIKCGFCIPVCPLEALSWNEDNGNGYIEGAELDEH